MEAAQHTWQSMVLRSSVDLPVERNNLMSLNRERSATPALETAHLAEFRNLVDQVIKPSKSQETRPRQDTHTEFSGLETEKFLLQAVGRRKNSYPKLQSVMPGTKRGRLGRA